MVVPPAPSFELALRRMFQREGADTLPGHLEKSYGIAIANMTQLDVGVFRVERSDKGAPLVARLFSATRPFAAAEGDLAVLRYLEEIGFPAERPIAGGALSRHEGQAVLVTESVRQAPRANRPGFGILRLGAMIGHLHGLAVPAGADRLAGALHHFAEGTMTDELRAAGEWLDSVGDRVPAGGAGAFDAIRAAVAAADGGDGLPEGFVHPDPVPKNVIFTAGGPVLVDWTAAGRGPRLPSLTLVLRSGWAAVPFMKGYARRITLTAQERDRLARLLFSRQLIDLVFRVCRDPESAVARAKRLSALRRDSEAKARDILAVCPPG
jgi:Ser/Thr protein kinase RdoA (MazF antagonist)